ncbi:MAG TPA: NAD-dependent epimerase/dehydratase family protein [Candidatus Paceibacterota bacterium]|nr:NAD-dependent epimerase/dehydratase family protein [Candidatus Paceibacterota bacterium]
MERTTVAVTGGTGFLGRVVLRTLDDHGYRVAALVRGAHADAPGASRIVEGDITDYKSLVRLVVGVHTVVHLAAAKSDELESRAVNVDGMRNLIEACRKEKVSRIIYVSTASAKIARKGTYAATKEEAETLLKESGLEWVILRPSVIYGDLESGVFGSLAKVARFPFIPVIGDGSWVSWPIHVDDVAHAIAVALKHNTVLGKMYDVGGPDAISFDNLVQKIRADVYKKPPGHILHIPVRFALFLARVLKRLLRKSPITESNVLGSTQQIAWNGEGFFKDFGFIPRPLSQGLADIARARETSEADILFTYIYSRSGHTYRRSGELVQRYEDALKQNNLPPIHPLLVRRPFLIGFFDAGTALFRPASGLQQRILIASALAETSPESARWLLPRNRTMLALFWYTLVLCASAGVKIVGSLCVALIPRLTQTYAR